MEDGGYVLALVVSLALVTSMGLVPTAVADHDPDEEEIEIDLSGTFHDPDEVCFVVFDGHHAEEEAHAQEDRRVVPSDADTRGVLPIGVGADVEGLDNSTRAEVDEEHEQRVFVSGFEETVGGQVLFVPGLTVDVGGEETMVGGGWIDIPERTIASGPVDESLEVAVQEGFDGNVTLEVHERVDETVPGLAICIEYAQP